MSAQIPLVSGDPARDPASSSRFVLPFGYHVEEGGPPTGPVWRLEPSRSTEEQQRQRERERYFTTETSRVLFRRARRFVLDDLEEQPRRFEVPRRHGAGSYVAQIAPPRLVLFEWRTAQPRPRKATVSDVLATGFLVLDVFFPVAERGPDLDELLELNEVFRHFVPPFPEHVDDGPEGGVRRGAVTVLGDLPVNLCRPSTKVRDRLDGDPLERIYFERWASLLERPLEHSGEHWRLFPEGWEQGARSWYNHPLPERDYGTGWVVYSDSRAFVWTCALLDGGLGDLKRRLGKPEADAASFGHWIKLLNVDPPGTEPEVASGFEQHWARRRTYERWQELGTVYGFSYHSGVLVAPPLRAPAPELWRHFGDLYFEQTLLLLYLRVTTFRFSRKLSEVTERARGNDRPTDWHRHFRSLRRDFALFTNLYQFPLLSNQQQGVELYALAREHLDVAALFEEICSEVESSHAFIEMEVAHAHSQTATRLTVVATAGLLLSVVVGFFGMNFFAPDRSQGFGPWQDAVWLVVGVVAVWFVLGMVNLFPAYAERAFRFWRREKEAEG